MDENQVTEMKEVEVRRGCWAWGYPPSGGEAAGIWGLRSSPGGGVNPGGGGSTFVAAWEQLVCFVDTGERACDPGFLVDRGFLGPSRVPSVSCLVHVLFHFF